MDYWHSYQSNHTAPDNHQFGRNSYDASAPDYSDWKVILYFKGKKALFQTYQFADRMEIDNLNKLYAEITFSLLAELPLIAHDNHESYPVCNSIGIYVARGIRQPGKPRYYAKYQYLTNDDVKRIVNKYRNH